MTEATPQFDPEDLNSGKPAGLFVFLILAAQRGDIPKAQTTNMRVGTRKVLDVVQAGDDLDLRNADLDDLVRRFHTLAKVDLRDETRQTYEKRFRDAVDRYRKFLADDPTWKQTTAPKKAKSSTSSKGKPTAVPDIEPGVATVTQMPGSSNMLSVPVPLRRGVVAQLSLPADLTDREAGKIAKIVQAFGGAGQLELPAGAGTES